MFNPILYHVVVARFVDIVLIPFYNRLYPCTSVLYHVRYVVMSLCVTADQGKLEAEVGGRGAGHNEVG